MLDKKVRLSVLGFSFNQSQTGTYGLVLAEKDGPRRLMVVVGTPEAQSIAFKLHNSKPPRPLTHDLFQSVIGKAGIKLKEVLIYKYNKEGGIFYSRLIFSQNNESFEVESRTSDAVALALRAKAAIYTSEKIMRELSVVFKEVEDDPEFETDLNEIDSEKFYSDLHYDELDNMLRDAIEKEDYEMASLLRDELQKKKKVQS